MRRPIAGLAVAKPISSRVTDLTLLKSGDRLDASKSYTVAGWASVNEGTEGPPVWEVVTAWLEKTKVVNFGDNQAVKVVGA